MLPCVPALGARRLVRRFLNFLLLGLVRRHVPGPSVGGLSQAAPLCPRSSKHVAHGPTASSPGHVESLRPHPRPTNSVSTLSQDTHFQFVPCPNPLAPSPKPTQEGVLLMSWGTPACGTVGSRRCLGLEDPAGWGWRRRTLTALGCSGAAGAVDTLFPLPLRGCLLRASAPFGPMPLLCPFVSQHHHPASGCDPEREHLYPGEIKIRWGGRQRWADVNTVDFFSLNLSEERSSSHFLLCGCASQGYLITGEMDLEQ